jgi:hypothetical protein
MTLLLGCREQGLVVVVEPSMEEVLRDFVAFIPSPIEVEVTADPLAAARRGGVALLESGDCGECYTLDVRDGALVVEGGAPLGLQYGLAELLEDAGFRFLHPHDTVVPEDAVLPESPPDPGFPREPEMAHRALHLHTLHPTDAMFDFQMPSEAGRERAFGVLDWLVKNRANHIQWMGLDDIATDDAALLAWREHVAAIQEKAHQRGLGVGFGVELYGSGNLQHAYDLLDRPGEEEEDHRIVADRLGRIMETLDWDLINLSFGEFFDESPDRFIRDIDATLAAARSFDPEVAMTAWVHVGDEVRVEVQGEDLIYYFLVKYADPAITRSVHTVMYYNLFDDAGGAYHHEDFSEHRAFLLDELAAGHPVEYYPESAYWCAFDSSVPLFLPIYLESRWRDLAGLAEETARLGLPGLGAHTLFTTGWEWGYWLTDVLTLRMTWGLPGDWRQELLALFQPWGADGAALASAIGDLAKIQYDALIGQRLGAWLQGVDGFMEAGYLFDIVSQPRRLALEEAAALDPAGREALVREVLDPLAALADETEAVLARIEAIPRSNPWFAEIRDGVAVDADRARFVEATYRAALASADGLPPDAWLDEADRAMARAALVVAGRHGALHDPDAGRLLVPIENPTLYPYGYLHHAHELCFWRRERAQVRNLVLGADEDVPGCAL